MFRYEYYTQQLKKYYGLNEDVILEILETIAESTEEESNLDEEKEGLEEQKGYVLDICPIIRDIVIDLLEHQDKIFLIVNRRRHIQPS